MCKETMELYNAFRSVPEAAKKPIAAGRLKGKTDINPMWRIKMLTEQFGPCGIGWYTETTRTWLDGGEDGEVIANVEIALYIRYNGEWSKPIYGIGGAMFISKEKGGYYTDDDAYKKAYTDALSVACKALGIAADVYWEKDPDTKYAPRETDSATILPTPPVKPPMTYDVAKEIRLADGKYVGKLLTEVYKEDYEFFKSLWETGNDTIKEAVSAIVEYVNNYKKEKKG